MLASRRPGLLGRIGFPLGGQTKDETRAEAARAGLEAARRSESQEACFLAGGDYRDFLERRGLAAGDGAIVDERRPRARAARRLLALHARPAKGPRRLQRRAALRAAERAGKNTVVVGPRAALAVTELEARGTLHVPVERAEAKLRYRSPAVPARVRPADGGFRLELEQPAYGVAPARPRSSTTATGLS